MKVVDAEMFREQFLELLDNLGNDGLIITRRGRPVARLLPLERPDAELIGSLRDKIVVRDDVLATGVDWDADAQS
ncbi:MAG: type II toxin-antitoxin system Phd/YefM family antitoxin [bacterium]|nr:type II toxin-antitoxin system Phd/YefM family antitoxin [bacterium]MDE0241804.1 type II toxin-antitoxin system Phd/YefM family antitoxin [bacterium]MDE0417303.1 type II toxin-antitoxin system Phd/YefM family antitoxin [bacterium]